VWHCPPAPRRPADNSQLPVVQAIAWKRTRGCRCNRPRSSRSILSCRASANAARVSLFQSGDLLVRVCSRIEPGIAIAICDYENRPQEPVWEMAWACDTGISRRARSEERGDAVRIASDERRRPGGKYRCPFGLHEDGALPRRITLTMRPASPAATLLTSRHPRATQTRAISQTGS
jgi:hypothetical protein